MVNLASDTALWGAPRLLAYAASKGAVDAFGGREHVIDFGGGHAGTIRVNRDASLTWLDPGRPMGYPGDPITLDEALNGAKVKVPTAEGAVMLTVAPGSSSGKTLRIPGKGFSRKDGSRGDQLVTLEIQLPEADADLAKRLEGWTDQRNLRGRLGV